MQVEYPFMQPSSHALACVAGGGEKEASTSKSPSAKSLSFNGIVIAFLFETRRQDRRGRWRGKLESFSSP
jgi:hypothetical protein